MQSSFFTKMVDELVEYSEYDPELADGIKWLDGQVQLRHKANSELIGKFDFYDMVYEVLHRHDANQKAKEWLRHKND